MGFFDFDLHADSTTELGAAKIVSPISIISPVPSSDLACRSVNLVRAEVLKSEFRRLLLNYTACVRFKASLEHQDVSEATKKAEAEAFTRMERRAEEIETEMEHLFDRLLSGEIPN